MGFFSHLFGSKKDVAEELVKDDKKRMDLWDKHLSNHEEREKLSNANGVKALLGSSA